MTSPCLHGLLCVRVRRRASIAHTSTSIDHAAGLTVRRSMALVCCDALPRPCPPSHSLSSLRQTVLPDMVLDPWYQRWQAFDNRNGLCVDAAEQVRLELIAVPGPGPPSNA
jgi:hypothetical protein